MSTRTLLTIAVANMRTDVVGFVCVEEEHTKRARGSSLWTNSDCYFITGHESTNIRESIIELFQVLHQTARTPVAAKPQTTSERQPHDEEHSL